MRVCDLGMKCKKNTKREKMLKMCLIFTDVVEGREVNKPTHKNTTDVLQIEVGKKKWKNCAAKKKTLMYVHRYV